MVKQLLFAHSNLEYSRPMGCPHLTWMGTAMHDMGSLGHMLQIDLPLGDPSPGRDAWREEARGRSVGAEVMVVWNFSFRVLPFLIVEASAVM